MNATELVGEIMFGIRAGGTGDHAHAGVLTGEDLVAICEPARSDPVYRLTRSECVGYIVVVSDTSDCNNKAFGYNWDSTMFEDH